MQTTITQIEGITVAHLMDILDGIKSELEQIKQAQAPTDNTELLTRYEVAKMLNVTMPTLHEWTKKGLITANKIGQRVYYRRGDVVKALTEIRPRK